MKINDENALVCSKLALSDDMKYFTVPHSFLAHEISYARPFAASTANAYTVCLPYTMETLPDGLKAYTMRGKEGSNSVVFEPVETMEAYKPYLVMANKDISNLDVAPESAVSHTYTISETPAVMPDCGVGELEFRGTLRDISNAEAAAMGAYILQANKQWRPVTTDNPSAYIKAGRAYLVPKSAEAKAWLSTVIDDEPTAISATEKATETKDQFFDLYGRRIAEPQKGQIYIVNGKKVVY